MFYIYVIYIVSFFLHLPSRIPFLGVIHIDMVLPLLLLGLIILAKLPQLNVKKMQKPTKALLLVLIYIVFTIPFVEWPGTAIRVFRSTFPIFFMFYFFTISILDTEKKLKIFIFIFIGCQMFRALEPTILHITSGYWGSVAFMEGGSFDRLSGSPHDVVNPNQLAWIMVTTVPFIYYFLWQRNTFLKTLTLIYISIIGYGLFLTGSRSGILSLVIIILIISFFSKRRKLAMTIVGAVVLPLLFFSISMLGPSLKDRYLSIIDSSAQNRSTFDARIDSLKRTIKTIAHKPLFGHGIGTSKETNVNLIAGSHERRTHNFYIETLQELGVIGFLIFFYYIFSIIRVLMRTREYSQRIIESSDFLLKTSNACLAWVLMNLLYDLSCFALLSWEWYLFGGIASVSFGFMEDINIKYSIKKEDIALRKAA